MDNLIQKLSFGGWVINDLAPIFDNSLANSLRIEKSKHNEIFKKTLKKYKNIPISNELKIDNCKILSEQDFYYQYLIELIQQSSTVPEDTGDGERILRKAFELLEANHEDVYKIINDWISGIVFLKNDKFLGASHPHSWGVIYLNINSTKFTTKEVANSLIHELAHQELFLLNLVDRLVCKKFDLNMIHAPLQGRERPPIGRLHSCHALYRMSQYGIIKKNYYLDKLEKNIRCFKDFELTDFSKRIINEVYLPFVNNRNIIDE